MTDINLKTKIEPMPEPIGKAPWKAQTLSNKIIFGGLSNEKYEDGKDCAVIRRLDVKYKIKTASKRIETMITNTKCSDLSGKWLITTKSRIKRGIAKIFKEEFGKKLT